MTTGDPNKNQIDPDVLGSMDVLQAKDADIDSMLDFIARYVRKVHTDKYIRSSMRTMPGHMFLEFIGPSNIAYLLAVFKNGQVVWDQEIQIRDGEPAQKKLKPLFSTGDGKKREVGKSLWNNHFSPSHRYPHYYYYYSIGKSLWNNEGRRYFDDMERKWMNNYKSKAAMMRLYKRWDDWIETKGKEIRVGDGSKKTFHSVMGTWHDKNDDETGGGQMTTLVSMKKTMDTLIRRVNIIFIQMIGKKARLKRMTTGKIVLRRVIIVVNTVRISLVEA